MKSLILKSTLWCILLFILSSTASAQHDAGLKQEIEKLNMEMSKAMLSGDMEKSLSFYAKDVISLPNYEQMLSGIDAIRKSNEEMKKAGWKVVEFKPRTSSVMSCGEMITEIGTFEIAFTMEGAKAPIKDVGKYLTIWEKQNDGTLKIKVETWNSDKHPAMEEKN
ncbi:MAG: DUF4440 domain-containing protein [Bacteroidota bacterium]